MATEMLKRAVADVQGAAMEPVVEDLGEKYCDTWSLKQLKQLKQLALRSSPDMKFVLSEAAVLSCGQEVNVVGLAG